MKTICIAGKNNIAVDVLEYCLKNYSNNKVVCICNRNEIGKNSWQKSLKWFAQKYNIELLSLEDLYDIEDLLFLSLEFDRIIKPDKFKSTNLFNIHFSMLPKYKGMYTSVLPILNGDEYTGVTLHRISAGIDTGEIIEQEKILIDDEESSFDLYKKLIKGGTALVIKNLGRLLSANVASVPQSQIGSTYFSSDTIDYLNLHLDINKTCYQIRNQIRAFYFRPYQVLSWQGIKYVDCMITDDISTKKAGSVLEDTDVFTRISTIDYDVILYKDVFDELVELIAHKRNIEAERLLKNKKILEAQDSHGWTLLTVAVYNNNLPMVEKLISLGADINILNNNGTNLLMYAKSCFINTQNPKIFEKLIKEGLSPLVSDYSGKNLVDYCNEEGIKRIGSWTVF